MSIKKFKYIYKNVYNTFDACNKKINLTFYKSQEYKKKQYKIIDKVINCLKKNLPIEPFFKQHTQYLNLLIPLIKKDKIKILDFGGGWGIGYANLIETTNKNVLKNIDYHIYDLPDLCEIGEKKFKAKIKIKDKLKFISDFSKIHKKYDLIFFGSSIQYLRNPIKILTNLLKKKIKYLLFIDLYLTNSNTFYSKQSHYNFEATHSFINIKKFENIFKKKYEILSKSCSHTIRLNKIGFLDMSNFKKKYRIKNSLNYLIRNK
tara:strand:- start:1857 stop:2639 length:783 start_codon:yes stop_codon:yes gene_type:complete